MISSSVRGQQNALKTKGLRRIGLLFFAGRVGQQNALKTKGLRHLYMNALDGVHSQQNALKTKGLRPAPVGSLLSAGGQQNALKTKGLRLNHHGVVLSTDVSAKCPENKGIETGSRLAILLQHLRQQNALKTKGLRQSQHPPMRGRSRQQNALKTKGLRQSALHIVRMLLRSAKCPENKGIGLFPEDAPQRWRRILVIMTTPHDASYKALFSRPELVRDLITGFIPDDWLLGLDYSTLERLPSEFITDDFHRRADDIIWCVRVGGEWVYLYFLIEFQSGVDRYMALRVMVYLGLLYQDLINRGEILADGRLPPVLPIVLYNGDDAWTAPHDIRDLIPPVPGLVEQFKPTVRYFLIDEHLHSDSHLASQKNLVAALFRFEHTAPLDTLPDLVGLLRDWLVDQPELSKMIARWLRATLRRKTGSSIVLPELDDLQELKIMLAERMERWAQEKEASGMQKGMQQGMQQGMLEGEARMLQRLLVKRFAPLSPDIEQRIASATVEQIEEWQDLALDASSLDAIFQDNKPH